jgi:hypothetical protein
MNVAIIGNGSDKFTPASRIRAFRAIRRILDDHPDAVIVSGRSPVGGIDVWAEKIAVEMGFDTLIFEPEIHAWDGKMGFRERNLRIAEASDVVYILVAKDYPPGYKGRRWDFCYHCDREDNLDYFIHVKSGACWTGWKAREMNKEVHWIVI